MLGMSGRINADTLASIKYTPEFGANNVYELLSTSESTLPDIHKTSIRNRGRQLFGAKITYGAIANWLRNGAEIKSTKLKEEFSFSDYLEKHAKRVIPLFTIDPKSKLHCFTDTDTPAPESDWIIISLLLPEGMEYQEIPEENAPP